VTHCVSGPMPGRVRPMPISTQHCSAPEHWSILQFTIARQEKRKEASSMSPGPARPAIRSENEGSTRRGFRPPFRLFPLSTQRRNMLTVSQWRWQRQLRRPSLHAGTGPSTARCSRRLAPALVLLLLRCSSGSKLLDKP
jgi:hypothetical protein